MILILKSQSETKSTKINELERARWNRNFFFFWIQYLIKNLWDTLFDHFYLINICIIYFFEKYLIDEVTQYEVTSHKKLLGLFLFLSRI